MNIMDPSQNQAGKWPGIFLFVTNGSVKRVGDGMGYCEISIRPMLDVHFSCFFFCKKRRSNFGGNKKPELYDSTRNIMSECFGHHVRIGVRIRYHGYVLVISGTLEHSGIIYY